MVRHRVGKVQLTGPADRPDGTEGTGHQLVSPRLPRLSSCITTCVGGDVNPLAKKDSGCLRKQHGRAKGGARLPVGSGGSQLVLIICVVHYPTCLKHNRQVCQTYRLLVNLPKPGIVSVGS